MRVRAQVLTSSSVPLLCAGADAVDMQEDKSRPLMLCATTVLNPGPARVGRIGGGITLPRTVEIRVLAAAGIGVAIGVLLASLVGAGFRGVLLFASFGAILGWLVISYSPLKGESLGLWAALEVRARLRSVKVDGEPAQVYVGICRVPDVAAGKVHVVPGAISVTEGSVDERGRFVASAIPFAPTTPQRRSPSPGYRQPAQTPPPPNGASAGYHRPRRPLSDMAPGAQQGGRS